MTDRRQSDRDLDRFLRETGARVDLVGAREILRGSLASDAAEDEAAWLSLIAPKAEDALMEDLRELRERIKDSITDDGLERRRTDPARIKALRDELDRRGLDGFIVPKADEYQGEFIPRRAERLQWLTGFSGSAGSACVLSGDKAAMFVDGRYTLQVKSEVSAKLFERIPVAEQTLAEWLKENAHGGTEIGFDPWLHTDADRKRLAQACTDAGAKLVAVADNPIDAVWIGQWPSPVSPMVPHKQTYAGAKSAVKRKELLDVLAEKRLDALVLTSSDSIAWLLNIRGRDVPCTPVSLGYVVVHAGGGIELFTDPHKISPGLEDHLGPEVVILETDAIADELSHLGSRNLRVGIDLTRAPAKIVMSLESAGAEVVGLTDPTSLPKAVKNAGERRGMQDAHLRDGIALAKFLAWIDGPGGKPSVTEFDVGAKIDELRQELDLHQGPSFQTIAGVGANGAIVHYRAPEKGSAKMKRGTLLLVDSGGQYLDGTTDVTRTIALGKPTQEMKDRYTRVLKGHVRLARAVFPEGTTGGQLDALAREALWEVGLDYDHGTGHGVGSYLGVHEGPQRISKMGGGPALQPGMVVSNEPGYYKTGGYGIRIENLVMVDSVKQPKGSERRLLGFQTLTCAPYDIRLIEPKLLSKAEVDWINEYHAWVRKQLSKPLDKKTRSWLEKATKPIKAVRGL